MIFVLDASAMIAFLRGEPGACSAATPAPAIVPFSSRLAIVVQDSIASDGASCQRNAPLLLLEM